MANTLLLKRSSTASAVPSAGALIAGELAVNTADRRVFSKDSGGAVYNVVEDGRSGGRTFVGGTASADDLVLQSTSHATKGDVRLGGSDGAYHLEDLFASGSATFFGGNTLASGGGQPTLQVQKDGNANTQFGAWNASDTATRAVRFLALRSRGDLGDTGTASAVLSTGDQMFAIQCFGPAASGLFQGQFIVPGAQLLLTARGGTALGERADMHFQVANASMSLEDALVIDRDRNVEVTAGALDIKDGITAPATRSGFARIYVDTSDGDLKVKFGDGTVKTIVVDT